jgi:outer membrane protein assembly factor BamA
VICRVPPRAIGLAGACALLLATPCAAQNLRKSSASCAPTCPPTDQTAQASEAKPRPKIIIDDVIFDGPTPPPDSQTAQRVIDEIKHDHWGATDWLDEILEVSIRMAWQDNGYFKVLPDGKSQTVFEDAEGQHVIVTIHVEAGKQYWLGNVAFRSSDPDQPLVFSVGELRPLLALQEGDVFNVTKIRESLDAMKGRYGENGYINFVATPNTEVNDSTQRISIIFEFDQGKQFRISQVEVHGLDPGRGAALRSKLHPGDIFRKSVIEDAMQSLAPGLGLSDEDLQKSFSLRKDEKSGTVTIIVDRGHQRSAESQPGTDMDEP